MTKTSHIILAAGGTGGHMMPAEAVADILVAEGYDVSLVTDSRGAKIANVMPSIDKTILTATSHMGGGIFGKLRSVFSILTSIWQLRSVFTDNRPTIVVGFGGYPSLPAVLAARLMAIPYMLHEQNAVLGRVNRFAAKGAEIVALSVEDTQRVPVGTKTVYTGNPVRKAIVKLANIAYAVPMGWGDIRIFVLGGSQGARILSDVVPAAVGSLPDSCRERLDIVHQARAEDEDRVRNQYAAVGVKADVRPYFENVSAVLLRTQLVISRAGASTLAELCAMGRPAILVPLAIAADDHQTANARIIEKAGAGIVMAEKDFTVETLAAKLEYLIGGDMGDMRKWSDGMRTLARLDAAQKLAHTVMEICNSEGASE
jgi:UDP-N-acetylglucosamine--N-acetylmuramyl-(pentapeptide) pyrophosphoryl-undecaprenol N-acetylglucosamine transferase